MAELADFLGTGDELTRSGAPEPLLLPRLAQVIEPNSAASLAYVAAELSVPMAGMARWPMLADATLVALTSRDLPADVLQECVVQLENVGAGRTGLTDLAGRMLREDYATDQQTVDAVLAALDSGEPESRIIVAATVFPVWPEDQRDELLSVIIESAGVHPAWLNALVASRVAPHIGPAQLQDLCDALLDDNWLSSNLRLRDVISGAADSAFDEVTRSFPLDSELVAALAESSDQIFLSETVDSIFNGYAGALPMTNGGEDDDDSDFLSESDDDQPAFSRDPDDEFLGTDEGETPPRVPPKSQPAAPRRAHVRVQADLGQGGMDELKQEFAANTEHEVQLWIGPPTGRGIAATGTLDTPEPTAEEREKGLVQIDVTMLHGTQRQDAQLDLPLDETKASKAVPFTLTTTDEPVEAYIWLQHNGGTVQFLELEGNVSADPRIDEPADGSAGINLFVKSAIRPLPTGSDQPRFGSSVTQVGDKMMVFGPHGSMGITHSLQDSKDLVREINERLFDAMKVEFRASPEDLGTGWSAEPSQTIIDLLRFMARWGSKLLDELRLGDTTLADPIQLLNLDPKEIVPLEYVYDRAFPNNDAVLCRGWREIDFGSSDRSTTELIGGHQCCDADGSKLDQAQAICPLGFWSLTRVIERHDREIPERGDDEYKPNQAKQKELPALDSVVFAAAPAVKKLDVASVADKIAATFARHAQATTWEDWRDQIDKSPPLLVLLPHHGTHKLDQTDYLEIGPQGAEPDSAHHHLWKVTPEEVGGEEGKPGPVVFLLGCRTAESELLPYQNFARSFQLNNASIVVATLATVFGEHAAPVANEFIARLLDASNAGKAFGEVLRDVRLAMFSHGYLMALALVAFGNADWILPAAKGTVDVSN